METTLQPPKCLEKSSTTHSANVAPLNQFPAQLQAYYRSKAFVSQIGMNPLVAAAAPIFFLVEKFQLLIAEPNLVQLREDLIHEVRAFAQQAHNHQYSNYFITAAQYVLCLWADEMILSTSWGKGSHWREHVLTDAHLLEPQEMRSFFRLLSHSLQDPTTYVDLLELQYLCLSLGFEGEYRALERGYIQLAEIRDSLYHTIARQRKEVYKQLEIKSNQTPTETPWLPRLAAHLLLLTSTVTVATIGFLMLNNQLTHTLDHIETHFSPWSDAGAEDN